MVIMLDEIQIQILRKPIKHMYLRVSQSTGDVILSAPLKCSLTLIQSQLDAKRAWIHQTRQRIFSNPVTIPTPMQLGDTCYVWGKPYCLSGPHLHFKGIGIEHDVLYGFVESDSVDVRQKKLHAWYQQEMQKIIPELINKWQPVIGVFVDEWGIKRMKTRWGSCNVVAHRIWLNLNLIQKPQVCLEYVLVHEMVHLLEANHSKRFYALMSQFMPAWREYHKLLEGKTL